MPVPVRIHTTPAQDGGCGRSGEMMHVPVLRPEAESAPHHITIAPTQLPPSIYAQGVFFLSNDRAQGGSNNGQVPAIDSPVQAVPMVPLTRDARRAKLPTPLNCRTPPNSLLHVTLTRYMLLPCAHGGREHLCAKWVPDLARAQRDTARSCVSFKPAPIRA